jgi:hypothetical protein
MLVAVYIPENLPASMAVNDRARAKNRNGVCKRHENARNTHEKKNLFVWKVICTSKNRVYREDYTWEDVVLLTVPPTKVH